MVCLLPQYPQNRAQAYIYSSCTINTCCLKDCRSPPLIYWCRVCVALGLERPKQAASVVLQPGQLTVNLLTKDRLGSSACFYTFL